MEVTVKFDLDNEEDKKLYQGWVKMKEITLNLEKLKEKIAWFHSNSDEDFNNFKEIEVYFNEMIWNKLI